MSGGDRWLRERLQELRREEEKAAPPYESPRRRPAPGGRSTRTPRLRWAALAAAAAATLAVALWWRPAAAPVEDPADPLALAQSLSEWKAPLDFLLEVPGSEILGRGSLLPPGHARQVIELVEEPALGPLEEI